MSQGGTNRPAVLENLTASQMEELEMHFNGGDREAWNRLVESYGWSDQDGGAVWKWFEEQPAGDGSWPSNS